MTDPDETLTLGDYIESAVREYAAQKGEGGMALGFVAFVEMIADDGIVEVAVSKPETQAPWRTLGYVNYLDEWYRDDARTSMYVDTEED